MVGFNQQVLRTDMAGMPLEWVDYRQAVRAVLPRSGRLLLR